MGNDTRQNHSYYAMLIGNLSKLSNSTIFNDLWLPLTQFSRPRYYSTSNNSKMVQDRANGRTTESSIWSIERRHFEWPWVTYRKIQWHEASRGLSATAELHGFNTDHNWTHCGIQWKCLAFDSVQKHAEKSSKRYRCFQGCSGAGRRRSAVPANIFEPERRSGKYCLSKAERWYCSVPANQLRPRPCL